MRCPAPTSLESAGEKQHRRAPTRPGKVVGTVAVPADRRSMPPTSMTTVVDRVRHGDGRADHEPAVAVIQNIRGVASNEGRGPETATAALARERPVLVAELVCSSDCGKSLVTGVRSRPSLAYSQLGLVAWPARVNGAVGWVSMLDGEVFAVAALTLHNGRMATMDILLELTRLAPLDLTDLDSEPYGTPIDHIARAECSRRVGRGRRSPWMSHSERDRCGTRVPRSVGRPTPGPRIQRITLVVSLGGDLGFQNAVAQGAGRSWAAGSPVVQAILRR